MSAPAARERYSYAPDFTLASRTIQEDVGESAVRQFEPRVRELRQQGIDVVMWSIGAPDYGPPDEIMNRFVEYAQDPRYRSYGESQGEYLLRSAIATNLRQGHSLHQLSENSIIVTQGSSEAILFSLIASLDEGEAIAVPEPFYFNYAVMAKALGKKVVAIPTSMENGFHLPSQSKMKEAVDKAKVADPTIKRIKAVITNTPVNPTGTVYTLDDWKNLIEFAMSLDAGIISDEAYTRLVYDGKQHISVLDMFGEGSAGFVLLKSFSKDYGWPAARLGYAVTYDEKLRQGLVNLAQMRGSANPVVQLAAAHMNEVPDSYFSNHVAVYQRRRDFLRNRLENIAGIKLTPSPPEGAFYLIAELPVDSAENFSWYLLNEFVEGGERETLLLVPLVGKGSGFYLNKGFGSPESRQVRIAFVVNENKLEKGSQILEQALRKYPNRIE